MRGFVPARRVPLRQAQGRLFVSAKVTKTMFARARPCGCLDHHPEYDGSETRSAQTVLAEQSIRGGGPAAPNAIKNGERNCNKKLLGFIRMNMTIGWQT